MAIIPDLKTSNNSVNLFNKFTSVFYLAFCIAGFVYQVVLISNVFFRYDVILNNELYLPGKLKLPGLNVCFRYGDIIDFDMINAKYPGKNLTYEEGVKNNFEDLQNVVTIEDIYDMTPYDPDILIFCSVRTVPSYYLTDLKGDEECHKLYWEVTQYFIMGLICYKFNHTHEFQNETLEIDQVAFTYDNPGMIFQISLNQTSFARADYFRAIVTEGVRDPTETLGFAQTMRRLYDPVEKSGEFNSFRIDFYRYRVSRLKPPYTTWCREYHEKSTKMKQSQKDCINICISKQSRELLGKVMFNQAEIKWNMSHVTQKTLEDDKVLEIFQRFQKVCLDECSQIPCEEGRSVSQIESIPTEAKGIDFTVSSPMHMFYHIMYYPKLTFMDYFVYVSSCIGVWFGLSFWRLNPVGQMAFCFSNLKMKNSTRNITSVIRKQNTTHKNQLKTKVALNTRKHYQPVLKVRDNQIDYIKYAKNCRCFSYSEEQYYARHLRAIHTIRH